MTDKNEVKQMSELSKEYHVLSDEELEKMRWLEKENAHASKGYDMESVANARLSIAKELQRARMEIRELRHHIELDEMRMDSYKINDLVAANDEILRLKRAQTQIKYQHDLDVKALQNINSMHYRTIGSLKRQLEDAHNKIKVIALIGKKENHGI